jgi:hypothetical protein
MVKVLELTADVKNPNADRRSRDWHKLPVLTAGQRFTLHEGREFNYLHSSLSRYQHEPVHGALGKLIIANAIEVEPKTFTEFSRVYGDDESAATVGETLFKLGRIGPDDFAAVKKYFEEDRD